MTITVCGDRVVFGDFEFSEAPTGICFTGSILAETYTDESPSNMVGTNCGYSSHKIATEYFPFASEASITAVAGGIACGRYGHAAASSATDGYSIGGQVPGVYTGINKAPFASITTRTNIGNMIGNGIGANGVSSTENGYHAGGDSPSGFNSNVGKFPFATDTNATSVGSLSQSRQTWTNGQASLENGYMLGGRTPSTVTRIDRWPFASDSGTSCIGDMTGGQYAHAGTSNSECGYALGGDSNPGDCHNCVKAFPFASDTGTTCVGSLGFSFFIAGGIGSDTAAFTTQGIGNSCAMLKHTYASGTGSFPAAWTCTTGYSQPAGLQD